MTPAQEAKAYAAQHDVVIRAVGRRYALFGPNSELIDEVGGYPAALNAMRRWVEDNAAKAAHCDVVREDGAMGVDADSIVGNVGAADSQCAESGVGAAVIGDEQLLYEIRMLPFDALVKLIQMATGATLDNIARAKGWAPRGLTQDPATGLIGMYTDQDYRVFLLNTATTFYCKPVVANADVSGVPFDDFNEESKARIRRAAAKMRGAKSKGAWYVIVEGLGEYGGFISRAEALAKLRRLFNCTIGAAYRKAKATIVYQGF